MIFALSPCLMAYAADSDYETVTTPEGLTFEVQQDRPIVTRNGIVAPVPFQEYMTSKFREVQLRLEAIENRLKKIEKQLES